MKPDVVVSWPRNTDYPLWREMVRQNRSRFNEIIVVFTETHHGDDYREFVREALFPDHVLCVESPQVLADEDWRNVAVNAGLLHSLHSEWIWFTEQDFFPEPDFFDFLDITSQDPTVYAFAVFQQTRMHPCSIHVKRELLNKTRKYFGIVPDKLDHFALLQRDLERITQAEKKSIVVIPSHLYTHMNGLSHNMRLVAEGQEPNYEKEKFDAYLRECLKVTVPLPAQFQSILHNYLKL